MPVEKVVLCSMGKMPQVLVANDSNTYKEKLFINIKAPQNDTGRSIHLDRAQVHLLKLKLEEFLGK